MFGLAGIHFFRLQIVLIIQLLLLNIFHTFGSSNYRFNRRSINTFVKENDDGTKQNVILVQAGAKNELIEGFYFYIKFLLYVFLELKKHLNQTDGNESQSSSEDDSEHSEEDQGDSDVSEERYFFLS